MLSNWGNYPKADAEVVKASSAGGVGRVLKEGRPLIARGLGRSYGDSSLGGRVLSTLGLDRFTGFDPSVPSLECEAGVSLGEILEYFVPRGYFLSVTPGTKFVTVGGAIAADVHGKNHHRDGSFSEHLLWMDVMLPGGEVQRCSKKENVELFRATCGGMGLTGVILRAAIRLRNIETAYIRQTTHKARDLDGILALFEEHIDATYSVAWIDCMAKGKGAGRSVLMLGEHARSGELEGGAATAGNPLLLKPRKTHSVPVNMPAFTMNRLTVKLFNTLYYGRHKSGRHDSVVDYDTFFYPLDGVLNWNRIYGKKGFTQYQFVIPKEGGREGLLRVLDEIAGSPFGPFLTVLKLFGRGNENDISFPIEGYTLALDFPVSQRLFGFLDRLDSIVLDHGGRLYLAKDSRMSAEMFRRSYENSEKFVKYKQMIDGEGKMRSLQSERLGI